MCKWYHCIEFILLSMWIFYLYFSELYFILYEFSKLAVISICNIFLGTRNYAAKCTRARAPQATDGWAQRPARQPVRQHGPPASSTVGSSRAMPRGVDGDGRIWMRARARVRLRSTRNYRANHIEGSPLTLGRQRRGNRQWRAVVGYRNNASKDGDRADDSGHD